MVSHNSTLLLLGSPHLLDGVLRFVTCSRSPQCADLLFSLSKNRTPIISVSNLPLKGRSSLLYKMGAGAYLSICNGTPYTWQKTQDDYYQMSPTNQPFPDSILACKRSWPTLHSTRPSGAKNACSLRGHDLRRILTSRIP